MPGGLAVRPSPDMAAGGAGRRDRFVRDVLESGADVTSPDCRHGRSFTLGNP